MLGSGSGVGLTGLGVVDSICGRVGYSVDPGKPGIEKDFGAAAGELGKGVGIGTGRGLVISAGLDGVFSTARFLGDFGSYSKTS